MIDFIPNFTEVERGNIKIVHHSTGSVIQIICQQPRSTEKSELWLEYEELRQLMECVEAIKETR